MFCYIQHFPKKGKYAKLIDYYKNKIYNIERTEIIIKIRATVEAINSYIQALPGVWKYLPNRFYGIYLYLLFSTPLNSSTEATTHG